MYPIANFEAIFAIGYPVAFEASAEDLETLGLISIAIISSFSSWTYCKLNITSSSKFANRSHHLNCHSSHSSDKQNQIRVIAGATVIESPV